MTRKEGDIVNLHIMTLLCKNAQYNIYAKVEQKLHQQTLFSSSFKHFCPNHQNLNKKFSGFVT